MILSETTQSLQLVLGEAMVSTNCDWTASYADTSSLAFLPALSHGVTNGTTPVTAAAAPDVGVSRMVKEIRLHNNDTIAHVVTLQLHDGANTRIVMRQTVAVAGDFAYVENLIPDGAAGGEWHAGTVTSLGAGVAVTSGALTVDGPQTFTDNRLLSISCVTTNIVPLAATYANGASGVGATLTATANGALVMDGYTPAVGDNVLVAGDGSNIVANGVYVVTAVGDGSHPYILTRHPRCNQPAHFVDLRVSMSDWGNTHWNSDFLQEATVNAVGTDTVYFQPIGLGGGLYINALGTGLQVDNFGTQTFTLHTAHGMVYLGGGKTTTALAFLDLELPAGYEWFRIQLQDVSSSHPATDQICVSFSSDGGSTWIFDSTNFDCYRNFEHSHSAFGDTVIEDGYSDFDWQGYIGGWNVDAPGGNSGVINTTIEFYPGSATRLAFWREYSTTIFPALTSQIAIIHAIGSVALNNVATVPITPARINALRFAPYGDPALLATGFTINAGFTYALWGFKP